MKKIIIALLAIIVMLGVSCKKESVEPEQVKTEIKINSVAGVPGDGGIGGYPPSYFPHNTGTCTCGKYATCNPKPPHTCSSLCSGGFHADWPPY